MLFNSIVVILAFGGFCLAFYIYKTKKVNKPLACPLNGQCDIVVHSDYSRFFGIPVEFLGVLYYAAIVLSYGFFLFYPGLINSFYVFVFLAMSFSALLFSAYLTFIQAFNIKHWCTWCLISASLCAGIFTFSFAGAEYNFISILSDNRNSFLALHLLSAAVGLGSAVISDILFFKFLKDFQISVFEAGMMKFLSQIMWLALGMIIMTGLGLYLPHAEHLKENPAFVMKVIIVAIIVINGAFLNLLIMPRLVKASILNNPPEGQPIYSYGKSDLPVLGRLPFALGPISLVSWISAFLLGMFLNKAAKLDLLNLVFIYFSALFVVVVIGLAINRILKKQIGKF